MRAFHGRGRRTSGRALGALALPHLRTLTHIDLEGTKAICCTSFPAISSKIRTSTPKDGQRSQGTQGPVGALNTFE